MRSNSGSDYNAGDAAAFIATVLFFAGGVILNLQPVIFASAVIFVLLVFSWAFLKENSKLIVKLRQRLVQRGVRGTKKVLIILLTPVFFLFDYGKWIYLGAVILICLAAGFNELVLE